MGTRMALNYAIICIHYLETNFLNRYQTSSRVWLRFIDDIFMIWKYGEQQLKRFLEALNHHHPTIKFTYTMNKKEIASLDTKVYRSPNHRLYTRIYHKPTDQKHYLHYHSAHPRNVKESLSYGLLFRCRRICTEDNYCEEQAKRKYTAHWSIGNTQLAS